MVDGIGGTEGQVSGSGIELAQALTGVTGEPIGQVETLAGTVTAIRSDGTEATLQVGDSVFQGDTLASGPDGAIGVVFADTTTFSMAEDGEIVLDEMVYDPTTQEGTFAVSVVEGVFTFVSGEIAKTDPDAMTLNTPVATIGIRGTQLALKYEGGEDLQVVLMEEADGFVGEIVVQNAAGIQILNVADQGTSVASADSAPSEPITFDRSEIVAAFGGALRSLPESAGGSTYGAEDEAALEDEAIEEELAEEALLEEELVEEGEGEEEVAEVEEEITEEELLVEEEIEGELEEEVAEVEEDLEDLAGLEDFETAAGGDDPDLGGGDPPPPPEPEPEPLPPPPPPVVAPLRLRPHLRPRRRRPAAAAAVMMTFRLLRLHPHRPIRTRSSLAAPGTTSFSASTARTSFTVSAATTSWTAAPTTTCSSAATATTPPSSAARWRNTSSRSWPTAACW